MDEQPKSFWWNIWGKPARFFAWVTVLLLLSFFVLETHYRLYLTHDNLSQVSKPGAIYVPIVGLASVVSILSLVLSVIRPTRPITSWILRRWFFCAAILVTVVALFYAEENWRGQLALDRCNRELQAKGIELNWDKYIPPPVPDDQNVFAAPKMQEWFVGRGSNELAGLLETPKEFPVWGAPKSKAIDTEAEARAYLGWSDQLQPQLDLMSDALKRPYSRMDGDYANPSMAPIPNFVSLRAVARILAQRSHCHGVLHEPDKALEDLTLMHNLSHFSDAQPTGKPMTLVAAMINVAINGLYAEVVGTNLQAHVWQEAQLVDLQKQLSEVHLMIPVAAAFQSEPAADARVLEKISTKPNDVANAFGPAPSLLRLAPRGWILQNIANEVPFFYPSVQALDVQRECVSPQVCKDNSKRLEEFDRHKNPYRIFVAIMVPNVSRAIMVTARNQNSINEALIACALERYHLANGSYPDSLEALAPQFIEKIPQDTINGGPLKYRKTDGSFVLYSIGWNETDDGGVQDTKNPENGDWVWSYAAK